MKTGVKTLPRTEAYKHKIRVGVTMQLHMLFARFEETNNTDHKRDTRPNMKVFT